MNWKTSLVGLTLPLLLSIQVSGQGIYRENSKLEDNADRIAKSCQSHDLSSSQQQSCFDAATKAYTRYLNEVALMPDQAYLTESIQQGYSDKVLVAIHSYTMTPDAARRGIEYAHENGATGIYVSLKGHRNNDIPLRKVKGKDWIADATLMTKIAQGFGDKVVLTGFSLGGILSIQQAKAFPNLVAGYVAMAPSFHGGVLLPHSEKSCFARIGFVRKIAENLSGQDLDNDFILGGCAIFKVSRAISRNIQNSNFANEIRNETFNSQKQTTTRSMRNLKMPGAIIHSMADQVVSHQVSSVVGEILGRVAKSNFLYKKYDSTGPRHWGDHTYFDNSLEVSGYDAIDFVFDRI